MRKESELSIFDSTAFTIDHGINQQQYVSPLTAIHQTIRRQNPVAAAAAGRGSLRYDTSITEDSSTTDPWEVSLSRNTSTSAPREEECVCRWMRRNSSAGGATQTTPTTTTTTTALRRNADNVCSNCGKRRPRQQHRMPLIIRKEIQEHATALLETTPQLRVLSPESTDMQAAGQATPRNFFQRLLPEALGAESGAGSSTTAKNNSGSSTTATANGINNSSNNSSSTTSLAGLVEYQALLVRDQANRQAATELASLLWVLAHEMTLEEYGAIESQVFTAVFGLVHEHDRRMAGLAALDALLMAPSADEEKKAIKFANALSNGLRAAHGDYEFLSAVSKALGRMASRTANVDLVESEVTRALEWLATERSDRRLAACLSLKQFAIHAPTTFHSKTSRSSLGQSGTNEFLAKIFQAIRDPQPIVRACAADALSQCLKILVERQHPSLTGLLCEVHMNMMEGLLEDTSKYKKKKALAAAEASQHGSLMVVSTMLACTGDFMIPRFEEVGRAVMELTSHTKALIRLEVVRLIPRLANRCPMVFGRRYLEHSLEFLMSSAQAPTPKGVGVDIRPSAYTALGQMILAMTDEETGEVIGGSDLPTIKIIDDLPSGGRIVELQPSGCIYQKLSQIFALVVEGLRHKDQSTGFLSPVLQCSASLVAGLGDLAMPYISELIDEMFHAGLSNDLIQCLQSIAQCVPSKQGDIEDRMLQEVSFCLAGVRDFYDPLTSSVATSWHSESQSYSINAISGSKIEVKINMSSEPEVVRSVVLSLQTLASFGGTIRKVHSSGNAVPLLPFVQGIASHYLAHPSSEVRRAAALTCCALLLPYEFAKEKRVGGHTGVIVEDVLETLLKVAVADPSGLVRITVVQALDSRYDAFLSQRNRLPELFLLLQDENPATRAEGLRLLGRLTAINPAPILPVLRRFLNNLIVELQCEVYTGREREEATRLLVVFLKAKPLQRLVHSVLPALIDSLPLDGTVPPRLASASLEALGELAQATDVALQPWVKEVVPHVLEIVQDQSSASKQRTSLRTLGQIASSTGYVIQPYLDYPKLLMQATDILPATKRAPWSLRREVIRTLGILGALDPDRYHSATSKTQKGGAVGGAYFEETDAGEILDESKNSSISRASSVQSNPLGTAVVPATPQTGAEPGRTLSVSDTVSESTANDEDLPAYLFMHEQYAMFAQPMSELEPSKRMTPSDQAFYPTVAIQALMRIFRDPNLAAHHGMVIQAVMFIFKSMELGCVPFLKKVVPHILSTVHVCVSNNLREAMLKQLARLSLIVREHLRPYVANIFDVVEKFWSSRHLATIFGLISNIAVGVPDAFRRFVPRLVRRLVSTFDELQVADWSETDGRNPLKRGEDGTERLHLLLASISSLKGVLGDYLHVLVPALLKLADSLVMLGLNESSSIPGKTVNELSVLVFHTISTLVESQNASATRVASTVDGQILTALVSRQSSEKGLPSRVVQPLVRLLRDKRTRSRVVGDAMIDTLCVCAKLIGGPEWMILYGDVVRRAIVEWEKSFIVAIPASKVSSSQHEIDEAPTSLKRYDDFVDSFLKPPSATIAFQTTSALRSSSGFNIGTGDFAAPGISIDNAPEVYEPPPLTQPSSSRHRTNFRSLQQAWDVSQRSSRDDWDEWMRRFSIQLLREAPAPALRSAASLAHAYQPLARELFSAAFACCWRELSEPYRINLVHALETAFVADVSPEILQALLNLAEFMEHDPSGGLPIDISILADLALKCRAYGKALHYKEREYSLGGGNDCVESLISINRKLDLQEAALGVLKASSLEEERENNTTSMGERLSRHQMGDMRYSVIWSTDERTQTNSVEIDLAAKEELWLAKLGSWTEALEVYERKLDRNRNDFEAVLGCMRCLGAIGEWRKVLELADENWNAMSGITTLAEQTDSLNNSRSRRKAVNICAQAAWRLGQWDDLEKFADQLVGTGNHQDKSRPTPATGVVQPKVDFDGAFFTAVLHVHRKEWVSAAEAIDSARKAMDQRMTALMAESYNRAYPSMVAAQTLAEMEEIVEFRKLEELAQEGMNRHEMNRPDATEARKRLLSVWRDRLAGCRVDAEVHSSIIAVRSLVLGPGEEVEATLTLSELSRQAQRFKFAERVLLDPLEGFKADLNGPLFGIGMPGSLRTTADFSAVSSNSFSSVVDRVVSGDLRGIVDSYGAQHKQWSAQLVAEAGGLARLDIQHRLYFAYVKHLWFTERKDEAVTRLTYLSDVVDMVGHCQGVTDTSLRVGCWLELGEWKIKQAESPGTFLSDSLPIQVEVLTTFKRASLLSSCGYRAWHNWALLNLRIALQQQRDRDDSSNERASGSQPSRATKNHVVAAVKGFVNAVNLGTRKWSASVQQDLLNLLTCLFKYGKVGDISTVINECIGSISIEAWLGVLPQLLARIHIKDPSIRAVLHPLLIRLGEKHPQALMYPLSVLLNSPVAERKASAESLMNSLKAHSSALVEEAQMVSSELIRVAILWREMWHEGLEDASRLYFGEGNVSGMLELLVPLHEMLENGAETRREGDFLSSYGQDLAKAHAFVQEYSRLISESGSEIPSGQSNIIRPNEEAELAMNKAWDIYYIVFRKINKQLPSLTKLELSHCSPALSSARSLELGVPGTYRIDGSYIKIDKVSSSVEVITSKQRPRKITMRGSDGKNYLFLLKGHEDLRQDERVMQLFGLVNALLVRDPKTKKHDLKIQRYAISALSHNCGVVGWVPHSDTLHSLIRDYRQGKKIPLNMENREMSRIAPDYDLLTVMQKVEVFTEALKKVTGKGNDLYEILWLKSTNSEEWLERRTKFTRSQAVMSMVGYILGLGDRHPSNLMLDKVSGRILHIDFGDCFEVAMNRDKFPEKVPFRLTRMLIKAMEVSGIEGSYRSTCERTMSVLRDSSDSLVTMLEAFVYDPLISWRLTDLSPGGSSSVSGTNDGALIAANSENMSNPFISDSGLGGAIRPSGVMGASIRELPEEDENDEGDESVVFTDRMTSDQMSQFRQGAENPSVSISSRNQRSLQMYTNMQNWAADLTTDSRIASIAGERSEHIAAEGSLARSRIERSMKQRSIMSLLRGADAAAQEEALNEKALKVIRRVQDKLTGTDFEDCREEPLDVTDQVQRLIVQATSSENLCQLFIGWCSFW